ncbi:hypothetical protein [Rhizobium sp. MHM7A]|uniref:hypothetical protein n=1 Tax=Rhizobium sp. MHM7A TaxID=2583233 RepID=UPI001106CAD4|nr:hypothetical protein [Rhizobium sp. MHM7A]TLX16284.1 hypothetical protein FFR93_02850 [Rhizobium sp. MHM7A]
MFKTLSDVGTEIKARQHVSKVPTHHDLIPGRVFYGTTGLNGFDFELRVTPNTTNGNAISLIEKRIAEAANDRRNGKALGQYTNDLRTEQTTKACVYMTFKLDGQDYRFKIEAEGMRSYKVNGEYEMNLNNAVKNVIQKAEMHMARKLGAQQRQTLIDTPAASGYRM